MQIPEDNTSTSIRLPIGAVHRQAQKDTTIVISKQLSFLITHIEIRKLDE